MSTDLLPPWTINEAKETMRMLELRHWLRHVVGCCPLCSLRLAILGVEAEAGHKPELVKVCFSTNKETCDAKARGMWAQRPKLAKVAA